MVKVSLKADGKTVMWGGAQAQRLICIPSWSKLDLRELFTFMKTVFTRILYPGINHNTEFIYI